MNSIVETILFEENKTLKAILTHIASDWPEGMRPEPEEFRDFARKALEKIVIFENQLKDHVAACKETNS